MITILFALIQSLAHKVLTTNATGEISTQMLTTAQTVSSWKSVTTSEFLSRLEPVFNMPVHGKLSDFTRDQDVRKPPNLDTVSPRNYCPSCLPDFTGGPELFQNMAQWTNLVCGQNVCNYTLNKNRCGNKKCETCQCDPQCPRYNDCCPDLMAELPIRLNTVEMSCVTAAMKTGWKRKPLRAKMVSGCPPKNKGVHRNIIERCHHPKPNSINDNRPVYSTQTRLHYRNSFCASCNDGGELLKWELAPSCYQYIDLSTITSNDEMLQLLLDTPSCDIQFQVPANSEIRKCLYTQPTVKTCNFSGQWKVYSAAMEKACHLVSQPVKIGLEMYENIFCASCNGVSLNRNKYCPSTNLGIPNVLPFSVLLNVREDKPQEETSNGSLCPDKEVYDPNLKYCRPFMCPTRQYPEGDGCVSLYKSAMMVGYILSFKLIPRNLSYVIVLNTADLVFDISNFIWERVTELNPILSKTNVNVTFLNSKNSSRIAIHELHITTSIVIGAYIKREKAERQLLDLMNRKWWWLDPRFSTPVYFDFLWQHTNDELWQYTTPKGHQISHSRNHFRKLRSEIFTLRDILPSPAFEIPATFRVSASAYIQVNGLLMCKRIELNTTEFFVNDSRTVTVKYSGEKLKEGNFLWNGDKVQICTNFTGQTSANESSSRRLFDQTEVTLTLVCTSLSLCGLAITLIIYLILPSLRTLPARNNIFLFANLFFAQLFFLAGSAAKVSTPICRTMAVFIHYFWLSTFCWKVVCAFHMYRLFTHPLKALRYSRTLIMYLIFSQATPCLIIISVIIVNFAFSNSGSIGYSDIPHVCFLSNKLSISLGFVLPVSIAMILNFFLFSKSVLALRGQSDVKRNSSKQNFEKIVLYFKMALLLGFAWIIGFVALIVNEQIMWYVFTLVNASIGVYVLIVFGVRNLSCSLYGSESSTGVVPGSSNNSRTYETSLSKKD